MGIQTLFEQTEDFSFKGRGRVVQTINGYYSGRIRFQATYWPARLLQPEINCVLAPGTWVEVIEREGLTLLVSPFPKSE